LISLDKQVPLISLNNQVPSHVQQHARCLPQGNIDEP